MGSANPKSIAALRWAAMEEDKITDAAVVNQSFEDHHPQLYLALALLCKGIALVTVKNTEVNNGLQPWRGLNATYDSNNKGRPRVRMQYLLQPKRAESFLHTTETFETWECDVREKRTEIRKDVGRRRQDRCHTCIGTVASAEPQPLELTHPEEQREGQDDAV